MANPIQAGSLASVIDLADNPPDQPLHSSTKLQQLTLYITRTPGSKGICFSLPNAKSRRLIEVLDVFLTTLKPQQKIVTAQDVQSSLYYMHLDRPEDYEYYASLGNFDHLSDDENGHGTPPNPISASGVRRKPLPQSPMLGLGDRPESPPEVCHYFQNPSNGPTSSPQAERKPFSQDNTAGHRRMDVSPPLPDRKLLGPRPMNQRFLSLENPSLQDVPEKQSNNRRRWAEQPAGTPPKVPPRPFSGGKNSAPKAPPRPLAASLKDSSIANGGHSRFRHRKPVAQFASHDLSREIKDGSNAQAIKDASLSLIRRYNNEQCNVGKILSKGTKTTISGLGEISIYIMTHGYSRFIDPIDLSAKQAVTITEKSDGPRDSHTPITAVEGQLCFQRHMQVPGRAMGRNQKFRPESMDSTLIHQGARPSFDHPRHSHQSSDHTESHLSSTNGSPELKPGSNKAYILRSPWEGICEFTTGVAGRSFTCKHSYTSSDPGFGPGIHSARVSELRFNLPSSKTVGSTGSKSLVSGSLDEVKPSSLYVAAKAEPGERLDLSLGREHAGGGFGGKQAKLGKLIIEKEGLQMLDLIVAANMALWWRVYERFT